MSEVGVISSVCGGALRTQSVPFSNSIRQCLNWLPTILSSWLFTLFRNLSFGVELRDSHVKSRIWQMWGGVISEMRWQNTVTSVLPALSCSVTRSLWWKWVAMQWATLWGGQRHKEQKMGRQTLDNTQQGTEALLPTTCKEQNPASRHMSPLGRSSSPRPALTGL